MGDCFLLGALITTLLYTNYSAIPDCTSSSDDIPLLKYATTAVTEN